MKTEIIKSESRLKRYKSLSFMLSLIFTGLGQVYNGELSKAVIFTALRFFSLIIIPLFALTKATNFSVLMFILPAAFSIMVWLISLPEAVVSSSGKDAYNMKKYNSILFYLFYALITSALLIISVVFVLSFFSIEKVVSDDMAPGLLKNEYMLINKYSIKDNNAGDVILFSLNGRTSPIRVIAKEGNTVDIINNYIYINDTSLVYSIIPKTDLEKLSFINSEDLFYEFIPGIKYPVMLSKTADKTKPEKPIFIEAGKYFAMFDNRSINNTHHVIGQGYVEGRVEGIIFSRQMKRIYNKMYLQTE
jgi:signal peptidase I